MHQRSNPCGSVVIPLYYAEEYIDDLLRQLRGQPLKNIEIICVIDGSPDGTLDIVKAHAAADSRIRWVCQENAGAGAARNAGLELAHGEYLAFLDADDLYDAQFLTKMYETAVCHGADLVVCQLAHVDCQTGSVKHSDGFRFDRVPVEVVFKPEEMKDPFSDICVIPHNKLYRREMLEREGLRFSITRANNDNYFVLSSIVSSARIVAIADSLVEVRRYVNPMSISSNRALHTDDMLGNYQDLYDWLSQRGLYETYRSFYVRAWANDLHYNATYKRNQRFIEGASRTLALNEPWCSMNDGELRRVVRLDTGFISLKKMLAAREPDSTVRSIKLQRLQNEQAAIVEIIRVLNAQYGKAIPEQTSILQGIITALRNDGVRESSAKILRRLR